MKKTQTIITAGALVLALSVLFGHPVLWAQQVLSTIQLVRMIDAGGTVITDSTAHAAKVLSVDATGATISPYSTLTHGSSFTAIGTTGGPEVGLASTTAPTAVTAGQAVIPWLTLNGAAVSQLVNGTTAYQGSTETTLAANTGALTETAPASDTASSGLNGRLQRVAQRLTSLITALGTPFQAGGSIGNTSFASTVADGANVTLGAKADAKSTATDTTSITIMQVLKQISASVQSIFGTGIPITGTVTVASHAVTNAGTFTTQSAITAASGSLASGAAASGAFANDSGSFGVGATGSAVPAKASYIGGLNHSGNLVGDIQCDQSVLYDASTSGNTQLVAISSTTHVYVCGYEIFAAGTANVSLVTGTGTACASAASGTPNTGTSGASAALTPAWQLTTQTGKVAPFPTHGYLLDTGSANALCIKTSAGVAVQAQVWYAQR